MEFTGIHAQGNSFQIQTALSCPVLLWFVCNRMVGFTFWPRPATFAS